jgi:hypothetical protein
MGYLDRLRQKAEAARQQAEEDKANPEAARERLQASREQYCTKHTIVSSRIPGGPDRLVWVYGPHRTRGNDCDGPEHRRSSGWW